MNQFNDSYIPSTQDVAKNEQLKKILEEQSGVEIEIPFEDDEVTIEDESINIDNIRINQNKYCLEDIIQLIQSKKLILNPDFQRNYVWKDRKQKSLLIESLLLRIPMPAFYFYEDEELIKYVIDGLQRLWTINDFIDGSFKLAGLEYLGKSCDNKYYAELDDRYKKRLINSQLVVNIVDSRTPPEIKYNIFRRLNTSGIPLTDQEIRNSMSTPILRSFFKEMVENRQFQNATRSRINNDRKMAQEMVLRFFAFYDNLNLDTLTIENYKSDLKGFLDIEFDKMNKLSKGELYAKKEIFEYAMLKSRIVFGECCFSRPSSTYIINKSLYTVWSVLLAYDKRDLNKLETCSREIKNRFFRNYAVGDYDYLISGTSSTGKVTNLFRQIYKLLEETLYND